MSRDSFWIGPLSETFLTLDGIWISDANIIIFDHLWTLIILMITYIVVPIVKGKFNTRLLLTEIEEEQDQ